MMSAAKRWPLFGVLLLAPHETVEVAWSDDVLMFEHATHDPSFPGWVFRAGVGLLQLRCRLRGRRDQLDLRPPGL